MIELVDALGKEDEFSAAFKGNIICGLRKPGKLRGWVLEF
jgi:hypothetical protein